MIALQVLTEYKTTTKRKQPKEFYKHRAVGNLSHITKQIADSQRVFLKHPEAHTVIVATGSHWSDRYWSGFGLNRDVVEYRSLIK